MHAEPVSQHQWLHRLVGDWTAEISATMGPDQPPEIMKAKESVRSLGGLWVICEGTGEMPGGGTCQNVMTLGFDPQQKCFVGTFVAGVMTHLWLYQGQLDDAEKVLTLNTEGPDFSGDGMAKFQDIITIIDHDHRMLTSRCLTKEGTWQQFMEAHYYRVK